MCRRFPATHALRRVAGLLAITAASAACGSDGPSGPRPDDSAVRLAFVDNMFRLTLLRSDGSPVTTAVSGIVPFAASDGRLAYWQQDTLRLYDVEASTSTATKAVGMPSSITNAGALSPDGRRIAFVSGSSSTAVYLHVVDLVTGARDSTNLSLNLESTETVRILQAPPVFSHDGQRVGFLLSGFLAMHFVAVEPVNWRTELHHLWVATSTTVEYVPGVPRWLRDGTVRFVARKRTLGAVAVDTLMILSVHPNQGDLGAFVQYEAGMPDTLSLQTPHGYSFTADGRTAAVMLTSNGKDGIFLLRPGGRTIQPLLLDAAVAPRYTIIVP